MSYNLKMVCDHVRNTSRSFWLITTWTWRSWSTETVTVRVSGTTRYRYSSSDVRKFTDRFYKISTARWQMGIKIIWQLGCTLCLFILTVPSWWVRRTLLQVLGPFPIHAREQHFLSPSFPINRKFQSSISVLSSANVPTVSDPIDYSKSWPSSYADGGVVEWTKFKSNNNGDLKVSFPQIRYSAAGMI